MRIARTLLSALAAATFIFSVSDTASAQTEKRVALIVGNSSYRHVPSLINPANDAKLMAETLKGLGFTLVGDGPQLDLDKAGFDGAVQLFGQQLQGADVALFYYAGHGVQVRGANYLVPVTANPVREADVDFQMLDTALVLKQMEGAGTRLNLIVLDACRNNPFGGRGLRATDSGLAQMRAPEGTLISFATQPGNVALDGVDTNSPFTMALSQSIRRPGLGLFDAFNEVGLAVKQATGGSQQPWVSSSPISGQFYFAGLPDGVGASTTRQAQQDSAERAWAVTQSTTSVAVLEEFIRQFGTTVYGSLARARLDELKKNQVAVVAPPVSPAVPPTSVRPAVGVFPPAPGATPLSSEQERSLKPKDRIKECDDCPEMVVVPGGSFTMGSPTSEKERSINEGPQRSVTFSRPFAVGKFEVTVDQFAAFVRETGHDAGAKCSAFVSKWEERPGRSFRNPGYAQDGAHPAGCLNWADAKAYVAWLSRMIGKTYRLLSEAEWEYVARAGTATPFWWGSSISTAQANYNGTYTFGGGSKGNYRQKALQVEFFQPNSFGLYQLNGNVWEWTEDCWNDSYRAAPANGSASTGGDCSTRVLRGGSWGSIPMNLRSAFRGRNAAAFRGDSYGVRVARTLLTQ